MIGVMPRSCDPEVSWWQGSVIVEIRPVTNPGVEAILDLRKLIDSVPLLSRLGFKVNLDIKVDEKIDRQIDNKYYVFVFRSCRFYFHLY